MQPFVPIIRNPHLLTILAHFWPSEPDEKRFPVERWLCSAEDSVRVLVETQQPEGEPVGEVVLVHGLEGSSRGGYMLSMARAALEAGYTAHRVNLRSCGGTEEYSGCAYHSGMTSDVLGVLHKRAVAGGGPRFVVGFSLGGNIALKLAGELGEKGRELLAGVCAVSTPIDLSACTRRLEARQNRIYELRFLKRLKQRVRALHHLQPERYPLDGLDAVRSLREFDNRFTARWFGFRDAEDYYQTQSAIRFLDRIRVPALLVQASDDPVIPFEVFTRPEVLRNASIELLAVEHGGHLGFLARTAPRFWADHVVMEWIRARSRGR